MNAFALELSGAVAAAVVSFRGSEGISEPFHFEVVIAVPRLEAWDDWSDDWFEKMLGKEASLTIAAKSPRSVHGIVSQFELVAAEDDTVHYRVHLSPTLVRLGMRRRMRIFQDLTTKEILEKLLEENHVTDADWKLTSTYTPRNYCVQYRETDLHFLSRLLEEDGICYFFTHEGGKSRLSTSLCTWARATRSCSS